MRAIYSVLNWFREIFALVFPLFKQATDFAKWGRWAWYVLHAIVIGLIVWFLWWLNNRVPAVRTWLFDMLRTKQPDPRIHNIFLPAVFLLVYALSWILRWIWLQLGPDADIDEFPDITTAWTEGTARLWSKGIKPSDLPLFLILGANKSGEEFLFKSGQVPIEVFGPVSGDPPIRLWASRDGIYVTAPGASALGAYADLLQRGPADFGMPGGDAAKKTVGLGDDDSLDATVQEINALRALARTRELTPEEKNRMRELATTAQSKPQRSKPSLTADVVKLSSDRLRYLAKLIAKDRRPFCPINGILLLFPWEALDADDSIKSAALALRSDMLTARSAFRMCAPAVGLVCDVEDTRGFQQFCGSFNSEQLAARIGQRFPLVPDQPDSEFNTLYDTGANWLGEHLFPGRVYQALQIDTNDSRALTARNLFQLYRQAYERLPRLGRMMRAGIPQPGHGPDGLDGPPLLAGCYLAGTGSDGEHQAFVAGVFERLSENQGVVAWSQTAIAEDISYKRSANIGFSTIAILMVAIVGLGIWFWK